MFYVVIVCLLGANVVWWRWADRRARLMRGVRGWRIGAGLVAGIPIAYVLLFALIPSIARRSHLLPMALMAWIYIWTLLILPMTLVAIGGVKVARRMFRKKPSPDQTVRENIELSTSSEPGASNLSRRQWLGAAAITIPPLIAAGTAGAALVRLRDLRVREIDVPIVSLPPPLEGLTIAQVSDIHIGKFTRAGVLDHVIETTNQLRADMVIYTGDLIDLSLADLPAGVDVINRLDAREGLVMIEGNHDLIDDPDEFERRTKEANLPILFDEARTLTVRGVPMQFLGIRWGKPDDGPRRKSNNNVIRDCVSQLLSKRDPNAFTVLLSHHPHGFDSAIDAGIPLTLSGHTHGGQLMLNERLGAGPAFFKYWSGLYRRGNSSLVVSNGAGNWFPLRINAPAEILRLTLRTAPT
jgi:uncharacterized protein